MLLRDHPNAVLCMGNTWQVFFRGRFIPIAYRNPEDAHRHLSRLLWTH